MAENQPVSNITKKRNKNNPHKVNLAAVKVDIIAGKLKTQTSQLLNKTGSSAVWNTLLEITNDDNSVFRGAVWCPICQSAISYNNSNGTSNLKYHTNKCLHRSVQRVTNNDGTEENGKQI